MILVTKISPKLIQKGGYLRIFSGYFRHSYAAKALKRKQKFVISGIGMQIEALRIKSGIE